MHVVYLSCICISPHCHQICSFETVLTLWMTLWGIFSFASFFSCVILLYCILYNTGKEHVLESTIKAKQGGGVGSWGFYVTMIQPFFLLLL